MSCKIIGILGGMGPEATIYIYNQIINLTPAHKDQDHIPTIIYSNTQIPDRTESIINRTHKEIIESLVKTAKILESSGVDFIIMPCNTAHFYFEDIKSKINVPILNMIRLSLEKLKRDILNNQIDIKNKVVGLLATNGTVKSKIYFTEGKKVGVNVKSPDTRLQQEVMKIIYTIKGEGISSSLKVKLLELIKKFRENSDSEWIILGCTELPLLFESNNEMMEYNLFDPMIYLAEISVSRALS